MRAISTCLDIYQSKASISHLRMALKIQLFNVMIVKEMTVKATFSRRLAKITEY